MGRRFGALSASSAERAKCGQNAERGGIPFGGRLWHSQVPRRISISFSSPNGKREGDCAENGGDFRRLGNGGERDAHGSFSEYGLPTDFPRASAEGGSLYRASGRVRNHVRQDEFVFARCAYEFGNGVFVEREFERYAVAGLFKAALENYFVVGGFTLYIEGDFAGRTIRPPRMLRFRCRRRRCPWG